MADKTATTAGDGVKAVRRGGMRALSYLAPGLTDPLFRKRGFVEGRIPRDWPLIVGTDLARFCVPESLDFPRGRRDGATLRVVALSGRALEIQHLAPQIIERVNGHFGWAAVARLTIRQGLLPKPPKSTRPSLRPLAEREKTAIRDRVAGVQDQGLRDRLAALGEALTARSAAGSGGGVEK
ncbi:MAG: DciA family protein [Thalassobaculaceae bacterium]|nr:DciA family protein [Thalassobaculaceae bacterium]